MSFHQAARDPRGRAALLRWNDDAEAVVPATPHGSAPGIHHEADQEAAEREDEQGIRLETGDETDTGATAEPGVTIQPFNPRNDDRTIHPSIIFTRLFLHDRSKTGKSLKTQQNKCVVYSNHCSVMNFDTEGPLDLPEDLT